jgi:hypothetical protein
MQLCLATVALLALSAQVMAQTRPEGDMDAVFGPAMVVNQGMGMSEETRRALSPGPEHELLARLVGRWNVEGVQGRNSDPVTQVAEVREMFGGAWFELKILSEGELVRLAHLGFDGYRGSFAMWEVGRGFTSPQVRVGEERAGGDEIHFWRQYTIRRRDEPTPVSERVVLTFLPDGNIHWQSFETVGDSAERSQKDVVFSK